MITPKTINKAVMKHINSLNQPSGKNKDMIIKPMIIWTSGQDIKHSIEIRSFIYQLLLISIKNLPEKAKKGLLLLYGLQYQQ